jgi:hypothetical protein
MVATLSSVTDVDYYLNQVATGRNDYYTGAGEAPASGKARPPCSSGWLAK